jgi:hypothetical protein
MSWDVQSIGMGTGTDHSLWIGGFPQKYIPGKLSMQESHVRSEWYPRRKGEPDAQC